MNHNVGGLERQVRLLVGSVLLLLGLAGYAGLVTVAYVAPQFLSSIILAVIGLILLVTGAIRWCPINTLLGRNSAS